MTYNNIIEQTEAFVKEQLQNAEGGHDWWHVLRVWNMAKTIAKKEEADLFIVQLGALLHDIADSKFHDGDEEIGPQKAVDFLKTLNVEEETISHIKNIIANISFKNELDSKSFSSPELDIIQDADRLDAIGAIGIARAFNYGGFKNRELYNPGVSPNLEMSKEEYKKSIAPTINHFYEKLLLLKDKMKTQTGKKLAQDRHAFMQKYLEQFYAEWEGKL